jgi:hypothetical protein
MVHTVHITYLLAYLLVLTPWSRVLLEKLTGSAASQEIPRILWNPKVHCTVHIISPNLFSRYVWIFGDEGFVYCLSNMRLMEFLLQSLSCRSSGGCQRPARGRQISIRLCSILGNLYRWCWLCSCSNAETVPYFGSVNGWWFSLLQSRYSHHHCCKKLHWLAEGEKTGSDTHAREKVPPSFATVTQSKHTALCCQIEKIKT